MKEDHGEIMELSHEKQPGYRPAFFIVIILALAYLGLIIYLGGGGDIAGELHNMHH